MGVEAVTYSRAGLVGNPSDGYFGKTISFLVRDFSARVTLHEKSEQADTWESQGGFSYPSVHELARDVKSKGYQDSDRLMKATIKMFRDYCTGQGIAIRDRAFTLRYGSSIPERVGMAGSSALVTATLKCLLKFFDVEIPKAMLPNVVLAVETDELGISGGLQDRVVQLYEGCVFMNFDKRLMESQGHGEYVPLDPALLPNIYMAFKRELAEGSEVFHNEVRERWLKGDREIVRAMKDFAGYAQEVYRLLLSGQGEKIGPILNANFDGRRSIFRLDPAHIEMVERARAVGVSAKFSGSGGAIVGTYEDESMYDALKEAMEETNARVIKPRILA